MKAKPLILKDGSYVSYSCFIEGKMARIITTLGIWLTCLTLMAQQAQMDSRATTGRVELAPGFTPVLSTLVTFRVLGEPGLGSGKKVTRCHL